MVFTADEIAYGSQGPPNEKKFRCSTTTEFLYFHISQTKMSLEIP